ncbi:MAG: LamG domain-containing protein [Candidatus Aenigmarchaeota archaeon]|nr:LamG domain-containing protein [Candidatus Aenigmarchaeota archaeon]
MYNKDNGFMGFYINGELNNFRTRIGTPTLTYFNVFNIGAELQGRSPFSGIIDEVRIYNRALSESEIKQLHSGLVSPGQTATIKPLISLSKGTHTLRLCTSSMCSTAILTV